MFHDVGLIAFFKSLQFTIVHCDCRSTLQDKLFIVTLSTYSIPYNLVCLSLEYASSVWTLLQNCYYGYPHFFTAACLLYHHLTGPYYQPITMYLIKVQRRAVHWTLYNYLYHSIMWLLSCRIITNLLCIITSKQLDYHCIFL